MFDYFILKILTFKTLKRDVGWSVRNLGMYIVRPFCICKNFVELESGSIHQTGFLGVGLMRNFPPFKKRRV